MSLSTRNYYIQAPLTPCRVVSLFNLSANYYNGATNNGVGATLTSSSAAALVIDGVTLNQGDRVLVAGQTNALQNGIYVVINVGSASISWVLLRSQDFQSIEQMVHPGMYVSIASGTNNAGEVFTYVEPVPTAVGTSAINFVSSSAVGYQNVSMTLAQFNGMYAAPFQILPAPGAGNIIVLERALIYMNYGSAQLTSGGAVAFQYGNTVHGGGPLASNTEQASDFTGAAANQNFWFNGSSGNGSNMADQTNVGLFLSNATAAFATGTGASFNIHVWYNIVATP